MSTYSADFPAVDAFVRWAKTQYSTGQRTADQLVREAMERYAQSPVMLEAFVREALTFFAIEISTGQRPGVVHEAIGAAPLADGSDASDALPRMSKARRQRIMDSVMNSTADNPVSRFFERHPTQRMVVPILSMTREELLVAAEVRDDESREARRRAVMYREIANQLQPGQVAGTVITETEVQQIEDRLLSQEQPTILAIA